MNKTVKLADQLNPSGRTKIAQFCGVDRSMVSVWIKAGKIPSKYNARLRRHIAASLDAGAAKVAIACLEPDTCPTCGQVVEMIPHKHAKRRRGGNHRV